MYFQGTGVIYTHFSSAPSVVHTVYRLPTESQRLRQLEGFYGVRIEWNEAVKCLGTFHHAGTGETFGQLGLLLCHLDSRNEKSVFFGKVILATLMESGGSQNLAIYRRLEAGSVNSPKLIAPPTSSRAFFP